VEEDSISEKMKEDEYDEGSDCKEEGQDDSSIDYASVDLDSEEDGEDGGCRRLAKVKASSCSVRGGLESGIRPDLRKRLESASLYREIEPAQCSLKGLDLSST
jgi:hypothetical protein